jgi:hypothetical protein
MKKTTPLNGTFASQSRNESICSSHMTAMHFTIEFNLYSKVIQQYIYSQFDKRFIKTRLIYEDIKDAVKDFSQKLRSKDFDNNYLKPNIFLQFCKELNINPTQLYDECYSFIFSDSGNILHRYRAKYSLNQKQLTKLLSLSPSDIGLFEKSTSTSTSPKLALIFFEL